MNRATLVCMLCIGIAIGACAREVIRGAGPAPAFAQGGKEYKIIGASMSTSAYEQDLNRYASEGWRYVGPLQLGLGGPSLVFER